MWLAVLFALSSQLNQLGFMTVIASGLVILPVVLYLIAGKSVASALLASKQWLERNYATVSTVILFAFGVLILMKGVGSL